MTTRPTPENVLATVLVAHGRYCGCEGACGKEHGGGKCRAGTHKPVELHAAPYPPYPTDIGNVTVPASELRPWCGPCWRQALNRARDRAAELRRIELEEAQLGLFDLDIVTAG